MHEATIQWRYPAVVGQYVVKVGYRPALEGSTNKDSLGVEWFVGVLNKQSGVTTEIPVVSENAAVKAKFELVSMLED